MSEDKLKALEESVKGKHVSDTFKSPAGDAALQFLDIKFTEIEEWVNLKLKDSRYKTLVISQLEMVFWICRTFVAKALT